MPTYEFTGPDGKRYRITGDGDKNAAIRAAKQKLGIKTLSFGSEAQQRDRWAANHPIASKAATFLKGVPFVGEYVDEAAGWLSGDQNDTENVRAMQAREERVNPKTALGLQIAGGIVSTAPIAGPAIGAMRGLPMAGRVATGAAIGAPTGAVEGAVSGYGSGTDAESRMANAKTGAMVGTGVGAVAGAAAPMVEAGVRRVAEPLIDRFTVGRRAQQAGLSRPSYQILTRAMDADGSLAGQGRQNIMRAGPDAMLADSGPNSRAILDTAVQRSGTAGNIAREAVEGRATRARANVEAAMNATLGPRPTGSLGYSQNTRQAYNAAYNAPLNMAHPSYRELEGLLQNRVPGAAIRKANEMMRLEGVQSRQINANIRPDGTIMFETMPDTRQLDYISRALGEVADQADGKGKIGGTTQTGRMMRELQQEIRQRLRVLNPDYAQALDSASTEIGQRNAREFGLSMLRAGVTRDEVADQLRRMPVVERQRAAEGVRQALDDTLANVRQAMTDTNMDAREAMAALRELSSRQAREKISMLIGPQRAQAMFRELDRASAALELRAGIRDNSRTFARTNMDEAITDQVDNGLMNQLRSGQAIPAGRSVIAAALGRSPEDKLRIKDQVYEELVRALTGPRGPAALRQLQTIEQIGARLPRNEELARVLASRSAAVAAVPAYQQGRQRLSARGGR